MAAPSREGSEGEIYVWENRRGTVKKYYKYSNGSWKQQTGASVKKAKEQLLEEAGGSYAYTAIGAPGTPTTSLRYPRDGAMAAGSDYVLFEFYKYQPPFQNINKGATKRGSTPLAVYNQSATDSSFYKKETKTQEDVVLYMPEDVSTGYRANWSGKAFSNIGASALALAGSGDVGQVAENALNAIGTTFNQLIPNAGNKTVQQIISKATGEQLSQNDIFGATRGVILNPNVELLFGGHDLRNFQLNYKLVPRNPDEAADIKKIINQFRKAMLPSFGDGSDTFNLTSGKDIANSFIKIPNFCRVSFMRGSNLNPDVAQYKMCAITQVDVNYTPDGTYATYEDGSMVAIQLTLNFQESKLIFASEVEKY